MSGVADPFMMPHCGRSGLVRIVDFGRGRGSDCGGALGPLGVEITITQEPAPRAPIAGAHLCFRAPDRAAVRAFHAAVLAADGSDGYGAPGLRPQHYADYYGAFVHDPDGHRVEAVCHAPERRSSSPIADRLRESTLNTACHPH